MTDTTTYDDLIDFITTYTSFSYPEIILAIRHIKDAGMKISDMPSYLFKSDQKTDIVAVAYETVLDRVTYILLENEQEIDLFDLTRCHVAANSVATGYDCNNSEDLQTLLNSLPKKQIKALYDEPAVKLVFDELDIEKPTGR